MRRQNLFSALPWILLATTLASGAALAADAVDERPATLQPPSRTAVEAFTSQESIGLRRPAANLHERIDLPFGLNYNRDAKSLLMPLDDKNEWGVGVNLNLNATPSVDTPQSGLQLAPKRTPGLMLHRKF